MKTSVERVDDTTVKLSITIEAAHVDQAIAGAALQLAQSVKVPGFRPGRVPRRVLESRLGKGTILQEAAREALPAFYSDAVEAEQLDVVGPPQFDVETFEDGKDATFTATVEVRPEVEIPDYRGLQVPHPEWEATDEELDGQLQGLRERFAELETVSRPARAGDHVRMTITGTRHGEKVEEASGEDILYEVGDPERSDSELDRQLVGAGAGAVLKFNDVLDADYGELAGQEVSFTVIVKEVKTKRLPELDDEFAVTASEFDTIEELREDLRRQLGQQKRAYAEAALRGRVVEAVAELVDVPLPESLVQSEVQFRLSRLAHDAEAHGVSLDDYLKAARQEPDALLQTFTEQARQTVKAQLVLDAIGRDAGVEVTREDLETEINRQAARLGQRPDELAQFMTHPDRFGALVSDAFRRKTIDHLLDSVQVLSAPPEDEEETAVSTAAGGEASEASGAQEAGAGAAGGEASGAQEPAAGAGGGEATGAEAPEDLTED